MNPFSEASYTNQDMLGGMKTTDQELNSHDFEEDSILPLHESVSLVEEKENLSNGGSTLDLENNEHLVNSDSEGSHLEFSCSQSEQT